MRKVSIWTFNKGKTTHGWPREARLIKINERRSARGKAAIGGSRLRTDKTGLLGRATAKQLVAFAANGILDSRPPNVGGTANISTSRRAAAIKAWQKRGLRR